MATYKYRLKCVTEDTVKFTDVSPDPVDPTECPDNAGHTINSDSIVIIKITA